MIFVISLSNLTKAARSGLKVPPQGWEGLLVRKHLYYGYSCPRLFEISRQICLVSDPIPVHR